ncbi:MAG: endonuclease/exonuclease/phosphatase family protein [Bacteroidota bacterium]
MKKILLSFLLLLSFSFSFAGNFSILTWNIQDLGRTKDAHEIDAMVQIMRQYDIVLIQEVVAKDPAGVQKVAAIVQELDRTGSNWDYRVSDPTNSPSSNMSERYAFLWNTAKISLVNRPYLDLALAEICFREPYIAEFKAKGDANSFFVVNYHSRKHDDQPEEEIKYFQQYPTRLKTQAVIICGDFNLTETHAVWDPLKAQDYFPVLNEAPTTLKRKCVRGNYLNYAIDNIFFPDKTFVLQNSGRVDFVGDCDNLALARGISDHLPVYAEFSY